MKKTIDSGMRHAKYARFIERNERHRLRVDPFKAIREALRDRQQGTVPPPVLRFELFPQFRIEELWAQVKFLLKAFGFPGALVTDESLVWDLVRGGRKLISVRRKLGVPITADDYIFEVAQRLFNKQRKREVLAEPKTGGVLSSPALRLHQGREPSTIA